MPVITISTQSGAGGRKIGKALAEKLGLDYLDKDILHHIALSANVDEAEVEEFEEAHHSKIKSFFSTILDYNTLKSSTKQSEEDFSGDEYDDRDVIPYQFNVNGWIDSEIYKQMVVKVVSALGRKRGVVIVGRGGQYILRDNPDTIHLRFVGDAEDRVRDIEFTEGISTAEAQKRLHDLDSKSADYLRFYFDVDPDMPTLYTAVLNTSRLGLDLCAELAEKMAVKGS